MNCKTNKLPACSCRFALAVVLVAFIASPSYAVDVTLGWDANDEPDLEGYKVYHNVGSPGPPYKYSTTLPETNLADPLNPIVTLTGLAESTKYFVAVTAYDSNGNESDYSEDVCLQVIDSAIAVCASSGGGGSSGDFSSSGGGGGGGSAGCFISAAGLQTANPIAGAFFHSRSAYILFSFSVLILLISVSNKTAQAI